MTNLSARLESLHYKKCTCRDHVGSEALPLTDFYNNVREIDQKHRWCVVCCARSVKLKRERENAKLEARALARARRREYHRSDSLLLV